MINRTFFFCVLAISLMWCRGQGRDQYADKLPEHPLLQVQRYCTRDLGKPVYREKFEYNQYKKLMKAVLYAFHDDTIFVQSVREFLYDRQGRLSSMIRYRMEGNRRQPADTVRYEYGVSGEVTRQTEKNPMNAEYLFSYDHKGRINRIVENGNGWRSLVRFEYDSLGHLRRSRGEPGVFTNYRFAQGKLQRKEVHDPAVSEYYEYHYDRWDRISEVRLLRKTGSSPNEECSGKWVHRYYYGY